MEALTPTLVRVAWMAVLLGLAMEALVLLVTAGTGVLKGFGPTVADTVRQVSWSGLEYGALGVLIGYIGRQTWGDLKAHLGTGLALGVVFGGAIVAVIASATAGPTSSLLPQLVNEVAFPMGCALVLYVSAAVARHVSD